MRIGIDARFYGSISQGLGRYTESLIRELATIDHDNEYFIFLLSTSQVTQLPQNFHIVRVTTPWYGLREQLFWPLTLLKYRLDLMHFTHFNVPILYRKKYIVTIHDLILLHYASAAISTRHPLLFQIKFRAYKFILRYAVQKAQRIITVSRYSKDDIVQHFLSTQHKISVIYLGYKINNISTGYGIHKKSDLPTPYLLYVGNAYPHKNLMFLIKNFDHWNSLQHKKYSLVLVGKKDKFYSNLQDFTLKNNIHNVIFYGQAHDHDLSRIYQHSTAYVFPSLHEGFGIPPLEAMQYDIPVLASNQTAIPEILQNAALYFDPRDVYDFEKKLSRIVDDAQFRQYLIETGHSVCSLYSWSKSASEHRRLYDSFNT